MKKLLFMMVAFVSTHTFAQLTPAASGITYGTSINASDAITVENLSKALESKGDFSGKIRGKVVSVCEKKGCWMKLANKAGEEIMVKFEDYGFFVPKDIDGKEIVLIGVAKKTVTPVEKLQHYAQDAGKSAEEIANISQPKQEIEFTASGVLVL